MATKGKHIIEKLEIMRMSAFIPKYTSMEYNVGFRHKMRGVDGNKKPTDFTPEEKDEIIKGVHAYARYLLTIEA